MCKLAVCHGRAGSGSQMLLHSSLCRGHKAFKATFQEVTSARGEVPGESKRGHNCPVRISRLSLVLKDARFQCHSQGRDLGLRVGHAILLTANARIW